MNAKPLNVVDVRTTLGWQLEVNVINELCVEI